MKQIRMDEVNGRVTFFTVQQACERFGRDELFEYLQGYHYSSVFTLEDEGKPVYPVKYEDIL